MEENKLDQIIGKIDGLAVRLDSTNKKVDDLGVRLDKKVDDLGVRLDKKVDDLGVKLEKQIDTIAIAVVEMQEQLKNTATKDELRQTKDEIFTKIDGLVLSHQTLDQELTMTRSKYSRLETRVGVLEQKSVATA